MNTSRMPLVMWWRDVGDHWWSSCLVSPSPYLYPWVRTPWWTPVECLWLCGEEMLVITDGLHAWFLHHSTCIREQEYCNEHQSNASGYVVKRCWRSLMVFMLGFSITTLVSVSKNTVMNTSRMPLVMWWRDVGDHWWSSCLVSPSPHLYPWARILWWTPVECLWLCGEEMLAITDGLHAWFLHHHTCIREQEYCDEHQSNASGYVVKRCWRSLMVFMLGFSITTLVSVSKNTVMNTSRMPLVMWWRDVGDHWWSSCLVSPSPHLYPWARILWWTPVECLWLCGEEMLVITDGLHAWFLHHHTCIREQEYCDEHQSNASGYVVKRCWRSLMVFMLGFSITLLLTEVLKVLTGRLRPHFLAVCHPSPFPSHCSTVYITEDVCTGTDDERLRNARWEGCLSTFSVSVL